FALAQLGVAVGLGLLGLVGPADSKAFGHLALVGTALLLGICGLTAALVAWGISLYRSVQGQQWVWYAILALGSALPLASAGTLLGKQTRVNDYGVVGLHLDLSAPALLTTALPLISLAYGFLGPRLSAGFPERKPGSLAGVWGVLGALALAGVVGSVAFSTRGHLAVKVDAEQMVNGSPAANCAGGHYPTISITNTGEDPLEFQ